MSNENNGGPAFPCMPPQDIATGCAPGYPFPDSGMTMRDYFAASALPAIVAAYVEANGRCVGTDHIHYNCVAHAYKMADAMLLERAK